MADQQALTIRCPRCDTLYRLPAGWRRAVDSAYRCARCRHVFDAANAPCLEDEAALEDSTAFAFDDDDEPTTEIERSFPAPEPEEEAEPVRATPAEPMSTTARFALRTFVAVTFGYTILSVYLFTHPDRARQLFERVPLLGPRLVETRLHPGNIQLTNLRGEYARVKGDHLVFVIAGTAVNYAPLAARGIQVEGYVVGAEEQRLIVACGVAPRGIHDLSLREIALLQALEPPRDWALAPGAQAEFLVVFAEPPTDLKEFGARVVAVQTPSRRGGVAALKEPASHPG